MKRIVLAVFSLLCCLLSETVSSQTSIPFRSPTNDSVSIVFIKKTDSYRYQKIDSATEYTYLVGNVELQQEKTLIYCDSMVINQKANIIESFGHVHINDNDSVNIYSDYMKYFVDKKLVDFQKKVQLTDGKGVLTTDELHYDMNMRIGTYDNGGKVVNNGSVLTSQQGVYYADTRDVYFKKNVILRDPQYDMATDSLLYNTETQISTFITWTDIVFRDSTHRSVHTKEGFYDLHHKQARFGKRPTIIDGTQQITGEDMLTNDSSGISIATGNVVYKDTAQGIVILSNRMESDKKKQTLLATQKPLAILKQDQDSIYITADTLYSGILSDWERKQSRRPDLEVERRVSDSLAAKKTADSLQAIANADTLLEGGHPIKDTSRLGGRLVKRLPVTDTVSAKKSGDSVAISQQYTGNLLQNPPGSDTAAIRHTADSLQAVRVADSVLAEDHRTDSTGATTHRTDSVSGKAQAKAAPAKKKEDSPRVKRKKEVALAKQAADSVVAARKAAVKLAKQQAKHTADSLVQKRIDDSLLVIRRADSIVAKKTQDSLLAIETQRITDSMRILHRSDSMLALRLFDSVYASRLAREPKGISVAPNGVSSPPGGVPGVAGSPNGAAGPPKGATKASKAAAVAQKERRRLDSLHARSLDTLFARRVADSLVSRRRDSLTAVAENKPFPPLDSSGIDPADSTKRFLQAYHHVRIFSDSLQAVCDSLWYSGKDSIFRLFTDPIAWGTGGYQVTGDTMYLFTKNKKADRLFVFENALAVNKSENNLYNQLKGITLNGFFKNGAIDYMRAKGNAESIYFTKDDSGALVGVNRSTADIIDMIWREKQLHKVIWRSDVSGTMYPIKRANLEDMRVRNFKWQEDKRPKTKFELFEDAPAPKSKNKDEDFAPISEKTTGASSPAPPGATQQSPTQPPNPAVKH